MASVEKRLTAIENDLAELRDKLLSKHWLQQVTGSLEAFPEFEEVLRLGRERRQEKSMDPIDDSGS